MTDMLCSLITPLKNERDNLEALWQDVVSQSFLPHEWIITDNGSTDGTFEWLTARLDRASFPIKVLSLPGRTVAQMLNIGIRMARHDIIACCHGGTRLPSIWLEELLKPLAADTTLDVSGGIWDAFGTMPFEQWVAESMCNDYQEINERNYIPASRSLAFRRSAWEKAGGFPEWLPKFGEDTLFGVRLYAAGCKFTVARRAKVGWRPKSNIISFLRQQRLYNEANACMGICPAVDVRYLARVSALLAAAAIGISFRSFAMGLLLFAAFIGADFFRLKRRGYYRRLDGYFLWVWVAASANQLGLLIGLSWRLTGRVSVPESDRKAIEFYNRLH